MTPDCFFFCFLNFLITKKNLSTSAYAASLYANNSIILTSGSTTPNSNTSSPVSQNSIDVIVSNQTNPNDFETNNFLIQKQVLQQAMLQPVLLSYPPQPPEHQLNQISLQYQQHYVNKNLNRDLKRQQLHFKPY